jgi:4-diphosphocytidyl-2-C-methyl-D-erythritol kinase
VSSAEPVGAAAGSDTAGSGSAGSDTAGSGVTVLSAPAKLTLSLRVTGVRPDGYHLLESEMVTVDLADRLEVGDGSGLTVSTGQGVPGLGAGTGWCPPLPTGGPANLVAQALVAVGRSAKVHLVKAIPPGAGLGGGSADAAAILRWAGRTDRWLAAGLGADVPFCVTGGRAQVRGIGEDVTPLPFEDRSFVLVLLPFGVDTGAVYRSWDTMVERGELKPSDASRSPVPGPAGNDLEAPALAVEPRLASWRAHLARLTGRTPRLAGSGSTWFVEATTEELGLGGRGGGAGATTVTLGGETALVVPVRTTPGPD